MTVDLRIDPVVAGRGARYVPARCSRLVRLGQLRVAMLAVAACAVILAVGAASAQASFLRQVGQFGSAGSSAGQFQTPVGVAIQQTSGNVFVADSANARVEKFSATGKFIAAWGWGVADGQAKSEVCTSNCQAGIPGSGPGQFSRPTSIAFGNVPGPSAGKVFVGDSGNQVVEKFDADGNFISTIDGSTTPQGPFSFVAGVAVDQSGNLWTADGNTDNITEFDPKGNFVQQWRDPFGFTVAITVDSVHNAVYLIRGAGETERFTLTGGNETVIDNGNGTALGLDPATGNLYVDHGSDVVVYDPTATQIDSLSPLSGTSSQGLAYRSSATGGSPGLRNLYASDTGNDNVTIYGPPPAGPPFITSETAAQTGKTTATLNAGIVPLGFDTTCTFQFVDDATFQASGYANATSVPCTPADLGSSFTYQKASANISGLTPATTYHFRVIATSSAGTTTGADQTFQQVFAWAPFNRCPVDDPAMLATTGASSIDLGGGGTGSLSLCVASNSTHGSITIGNISTPTGNTNLQFGLAFDNSTGVGTVVAPTGGALVADPVQLTTPIGQVTATVQSAGTPSDFSIIAGISIGQPIITVPIKIHLENPVLGPSCFIGSDQNPIVLHPANTDLSNAMLAILSFDANGVPDPSGDLAEILVSGAVQGDDTFAVPGATGCGTNDSLDGAVDAVAGLPSASGSNHLVLDNASSDLAVGINVTTGVGLTGQQFANDWHIGFGM